MTPGVNRLYATRTIFALLNPAFQGRAKMIAPLRGAWPSGPLPEGGRVRGSINAPAFINVALGDGRARALAARAAGWEMDYPSRKRELTALSKPFQPTAAALRRRCLGIPQKCVRAARSP